MGKQAKARKERRENPAWTPFVRMDTFHTPDGNRPIPDHIAVYKNSLFMVTMTEQPRMEPFGRIIWLSIKHNDRTVIRDWRQLQRIKNELVGKEVDAVEVFPAESKLVDTSNQYHLWCFPEYRLPFGYDNRCVLENPQRDPRAAWARQRAFEPGEKPADCMTETNVSDSVMEEQPLIRTDISWPWSGDR